MADMTRETMIEAAKQAASQANGALSRDDFIRLSGISSYYIYNLFPDGGWTEIQELAGIALHPNRHDPISDDELLAGLHKVACELGTIPTLHKLNASGGYSASTITRRFGGLQGMLKRYRGWLEVHAPDSPLLQQLHAKSKHETPTAPQAIAAPSGTWQKRPGIEYGAPINFRGLRHAPINEQGVVYLFGMVSFELGLIVEAVQAGYPDCEAKRCVDEKRDRWQRVQIEFEFQSRNFRDHCHDPAGCDLIVCWDHNWPECPLEVIELRTVINRLEG